MEIRSKKEKEKGEKKRTSGKTLMKSNFMLYMK